MLLLFVYVCVTEGEKNIAVHHYIALTEFLSYNPAKEVGVVNGNRDFARRRD